MEDSFTPEPSLSDTNKEQRPKEILSRFHVSSPRESVIRNILNYSKALSVLKPAAGTFLVIGN
ncbi:MAG: hypothetical protein FJY10_02300 [Bacteroidetes bacterium]|nr:hypothetical protein [Bacteroidota bacterium]